MLKFKIKTAIFLLSLLFSSFLLGNLCGIAAEPQETHKLGIEYKLEYDQEISLRVTQVPTEFGMQRKTLDGKSQPLSVGEHVIFENIADIKNLKEETLIPAESKFLAKVVNVEDAKHFNKDGFVQLEFEKILVRGSVIDLNENSLTADNLAQRESFKNQASKIGKVAAYTVGGAIIAPFIAYKIAGLFAFSSPYVTGGAAALGAAAGLATGIYSKGNNFNLEPGSEIKIKLNNDWIISQFEDENLAEALELLADSKEASSISGNQDLLNPNQELEKKSDYIYQNLSFKKIEKQLDLKINKVKKASSSMGKKCMKVNLDYKNHTEKSLRYLSFRLVDSMKKDYYPESRSGALGELPKAANLDLFYCVDYLKAIHRLEVRSLENYELLAEEKVIL
ncbi:MAG: hypothetical protein HRT47_11250 [Candidatus Caenarcaniphilales bacterium]|nr:hypothetical protein [Candidatus Caenarcaniphilales bacterium]